MAKEQNEKQRSFISLDTGTSMKSGGAKLVLWAPVSDLGQMRPCAS
jgi:hypothetical protein